MEKEIIEVLVRNLAELLAWKDKVQQVSGKNIYEYENELMKEIELLSAKEK